MRAQRKDSNIHITVIDHKVNRVFELVFSLPAKTLQYIISRDLRATNWMYDNFNSLSYSSQDKVINYLSNL